MLILVNHFIGVRCVYLRVVKAAWEATPLARIPNSTSAKEGTSRVISRVPAATHAPHKAGKTVIKDS